MEVVTMIISGVLFAWLLAALTEPAASRDERPSDGRKKRRKDS